MEDKQESPENGKPDYERLYKELMAQRLAEESKHIDLLNIAHGPEADLQNIRKMDVESML